MLLNLSPRSQSDSTLDTPADDGGGDMDSSSSRMCCGCEILRNGKKIAGKNEAALPGAAISLSLKCDGTPTDIEWSIPDKSFRNYTLSAPQNSITFLSDSDIHQQTPPVFHWADSGEKKISVSFKINGEECSARASIYVEKLTSYLSVTYLAPTLTLKGGVLVLANLTLPAAAGIAFKGFVAKPPKGDIGYIQIIDDDLLVRLKDKDDVLNEECLLATTKGNIALDSLPINPAGKTGVELQNGDSPAVVVLQKTQSDTKIAFSRGSRRFRTYLMFKPPGGKWVPIKYVKWRAWGCVENETLSAKFGSEAYAAVDTSEHPLWTAAGDADQTDLTSGKCPLNLPCAEWEPRTLDDW